MKPDIRSSKDIINAFKHGVNVTESPVKPNDKRRKFPGATTKRGYGPVMNPSLKNTMSSVVGGAGEASQPASAPAAGAGTGAVMASVSDEMFLEFLNKLKTPENATLIESIEQGYELLKNG